MTPRLERLVRCTVTWGARGVLAVALAGFLGSVQCGYYAYYDDDDWCHRHDDDDEIYHCHDDDTPWHDDEDDLAHHSTSADGDPHGGARAVPSSGPVERAAGSGAAFGHAHLLDAGADALGAWRLEVLAVTTDAAGVRELAVAPLFVRALVGAGPLDAADFQAVADRVLLANGALLAPVVGATGGGLEPAGVRIGPEGVLVGYALAEGGGELARERHLPELAAELPGGAGTGGADAALLLVFDGHGDLVGATDATALVFSAPAGAER